jgi:hypothetical protein
MMKLTLYNYVSDVPPKKRYKPGVDYQVFEFDVGPDEALAYFDRLIYPRDMFCLEVPEYLLDCWKYEDSIWVEVAGADLWATSEVSGVEARAVFEMLDRGERLSGRMPVTRREWNAYALLGEDKLVHDAAI